MPRFVIETIDDDRLDDYRHLPRRKASRMAAHFVVEGRWLVQRLIASEIEVVSVLCREACADEFAQLAPGVPLLVATRSMIEQVVGFEFHRGVLACGVRPAAIRLDSLAHDDRGPKLYAVCVGVCDQENLGSVIRNCEALGVDALLIDVACADPYSRRVLRVSMGAGLQLPIVESADLAGDLARLRREQDFKITATSLSKAATPLHRAPTHARMAVVFGNEGHGLSEPWSRSCDQQVTIAMRGEVDSLNIAVASGIFLHHFSQQQRSLG